MIFAPPFSKFFYLMKMQQKIHALKRLHVSKYSLEKKSTRAQTRKKKSGKPDNLGCLYTELNPLHALLPSTLACFYSFYKRQPMFNQQNINNGLLHNHGSPHAAQQKGCVQPRIDLKPLRVCCSLQHVYITFSCIHSAAVLWCESCIRST